MLKRTERLIDAVKLVYLLESMEGKDAELSIKKVGGVWLLNYEICGRCMKEESEILSTLIDKAIKISEGLNGRNSVMPVLHDKNMAGEE